MMIGALYLVLQLNYSIFCSRS